MTHSHMLNSSSSLVLFPPPPCSLVAVAMSSLNFSVNCPQVGICQNIQLHPMVNWDDWREPGCYLESYGKSVYYVVSFLWTQVSVSAACVLILVFAGFLLYWQEFMWLVCLNPSLVYRLDFWINTNIVFLVVNTFAQLDKLLYFTVQEHAVRTVYKQ